MSNEEMKSFKLYCQRMGYEEKAELLRICEDVDATNATWLYSSIIEGTSYEAISRAVYVPSSKRAFYRRQTKVLEKMREKCVLNARWNI